MIDLFDEHINRLDNLFKRDVLLNSFMNYANFEIKDIHERNEFKQHINKWMKDIKFNSYRFPNCVLSVEQFIDLCVSIGLPFPLTIYTNYQNIKIISNTTDEDGLVKAHDCYLSLIDFLLPVKLKMRLLYIPHDGKLLKVVFTGINYKYVMKTIEYNEKPNIINKVVASDFIKCIPFKFIHQIVLGCKANDESYINIWIETIKNNI